MIEQNKTTQKPEKSVADYLVEIQNITKGVDCVFRGQADDDWRLKSGAERRIKSAMLTAIPSSSSKQNATQAIISALKKDEGWLLSDNMVDYHKNLLAEARHKGFGLLDGRELSDLELLTQLQHFGAATCLLDFTENALVALYFSCRSNDCKDGEIFCVPHRNISTAPKNIEISELLQNRKLYQWRPIMQGAVERRIICQAGLFLINLPHDQVGIEKIPIKAADKERIRGELKNTYQISADTLFIDLSGFAQNQASRRDLEEYWARFYIGLAKNDLGYHEASIADYDETIRLKSDLAVAYMNRGNTKTRLRDHKAAIVDYDEAIHLKPGDAMVYYNRGIAKDNSGQHEAAIADYDEAIRLGLDFAPAYMCRGIAKYNLGQYEAAIADYTEAIRLQPDYAEAYYNRGSAWVALSNWKHARADLQKALRLAKEQNLSPLVAIILEKLNILNTLDD